MYRVEFTSAAARQVRKLDRPVRTRLLNAIETLARSPAPTESRSLQARRMHGASALATTGSFTQSRTRSWSWRSYAWHTDARPIAR